MLSSSSMSVQPLWLCVVAYWCVVENFCFWYFLESLLVFHEGTDALDEVTDLDADIPYAGNTCP